MSIGVLFSCFSFFNFLPSCMLSKSAPNPSEAPSSLSEVSWLVTAPVVVLFNYSPPIKSIGLTEKEKVRCPVVLVACLFASLAAHVYIAILRTRHPVPVLCMCASSNGQVPETTRFI